MARWLVLAPIAVGLAVVAAPRLARAQQGEAPHLLDCRVHDTVHLTQDGTLAPDPTVPPGARIQGRIDQFVVDLTEPVVRLPGLGNIGWTEVEGSGNSNVLILTPSATLASAASVSIHINRAPNVIWFMFVDMDRVMSGNCTLIPT